jgi:hypothetical protein
MSTRRGKLNCSQSGCRTPGSAGVRIVVCTRSVICESGRAPARLAAEHGVRLLDAIHRCGRIRPHLVAGIPTSRACLRVEDPSLGRGRPR